MVINPDANEICKKNTPQNCKVILARTSKTTKPSQEGIHYALSKWNMALDLPFQQNVRCKKNSWISKVERIYNSFPSSFDRSYTCNLHNRPLPSYLVHYFRHAIQFTPPLNRAQVDKNALKNISMAFFMSDQANLEYVKIETFPLAVFPHLQPIYVTNGLNSIRKIYQAYLY